MLENLTIDSFAGHKGSAFRLITDGNLALDLTLAEVTALGDSGLRQAFSLNFHSPVGRPA